MNAVERLLAHGEQALRVFGDVYRVEVRRVFTYADRIEAERESEAEQARAEPVARRVVELLDRDAGWQGWQSRALLAAAVRLTLDHKPASARPAEALRVYRELLDERRRLLSPKRVDALLADVVATSTAYGPLARDVVRRAEAVAEALGRLRSLPGDPSPWGFSGDRLDAAWQRLRRPLRGALGRLYAFKLPPAAEKPAGRQKTGRPKQADERKQRELVEGWRTFEQQYRGDGRPTKRQYIAERCRGQRKGATEQAALETRVRRDLETALATRRRKRQQIRAARTK
jgi:hypothetical protein